MCLDFSMFENEEPHWMHHDTITHWTDGEGLVWAIVHDKHTDVCLIPCHAGMSKQNLWFELECSRLAFPLSHGTMESYVSYLRNISRKQGETCMLSPLTYSYNTSIHCARNLQRIGISSSDTPRTAWDPALHCVVSLSLQRPEVQPNSRHSKGSF